MFNILNKQSSLVVFCLIITFSSSSLWANQLEVSVNGQDVSLDWSAMSAAPSYTLYYTLSTSAGTLDLNTLGSIEMGADTSFFVADLQSGLIIYTAIVAHTAEGDVLSNIVELIPFGGELDFPDSGSVLVSVDDPGRTGNFTISGTRNADGSMATMTQIAGNDGSGYFIAEIANDKFTSYRKGDLTDTFTYHADGSMSIQTTHTAKSLYGIAAKSKTTVDCKQSRDEYKNLLKPSKFWPFDEKVYERAYEQGFPVDMYKYLAHSLSAILENSLVTKPTAVTQQIVYSKLAAYVSLMHSSLEGTVDEMLAEYDKQCGDNQQSTDNGAINITIDCPIPAGAEAGGGGNVRYYTLNGVTVGPMYRWLDDSAGKTYLFQESCRNTSGVKQGWFIEYRDTGIMHYAIYFNNGQNEHEYNFYPDGSLWYDKIRDNGEFVSTAAYDESGNLTRYCDVEGCTNY